MEGEIIMKRLIIVVLLISVFLSVSPSESLAGDAIKNYFTQQHSMVDFNTVSGKIYATIKAVGIAVATIVMLLMAISYMTANGSKKAALKEKFVYYVIGVIILLSAVTLLGVYEKFARGLTGTSSPSGSSASTYNSNSNAAEGYEQKQQEKPYTDSIKTSAEKADALEDQLEEAYDYVQCIGLYCTKYDLDGLSSEDSITLDSNLTEALNYFEFSTDNVTLSSLKNFGKIAQEKADSLGDELTKAEEDLANAKQTYKDYKSGDFVEK